MHTLEADSTRSILEMKERRINRYTLNITFIATAFCKRTLINYTAHIIHRISVQSKTVTFVIPNFFIAYSTHS